MVMLDFICMGSAELWGTGNKRKIQNENILLRQESSKRPIAFQPDALDSLATGIYVLYAKNERSAWIQYIIWVKVFVTEW